MPYALQTRINEPKRVPRQSTSVFETSNFNTLLSDKRPYRTEILWKEIRAPFTHNNLMVRHIHAP